MSYVITEAMQMHFVTRLILSDYDFGVVLLCVYISMLLRRPYRRRLLLRSINSTPLEDNSVSMCYITSTTSSANRAPSFIIAVKNNENRRFAAAVS